MAVLKKFGKASDGLLSFPFEGLTLAIDFPLRGNELLLLLDQLDNTVIANGGRTYLAKDARMKPESFKAMYPQLEKWQQIKMHVDPKNVFNSDLSRRLKMGVW
jgi:FAD/FMN-containing dehydrogenase